MEFDRTRTSNTIEILAKKLDKFISITITLVVFHVEPVDKVLMNVVQSPVSTMYDDNGQYRHLQLIFNANMKRASIITASVTQYNICMTVYTNVQQNSAITLSLLWDL